MRKSNRECSKKIDAHKDSSVEAKDTNSLNKTKNGNKFSKAKGIDSIVLNQLVSQLPDSHYYHEESSYRYHNPPFPDGGEQLAIVRAKTIRGKMTPVEDSKLGSLPRPPPLPPLPESDHCKWKFDEVTRVLLADFKTPSVDKEVIITAEDEHFLMTMMERDDITVISEGIAANVDLSLLDQDYMNACIGSQFHYKVKEFKKTAPKSKGRNLTGEVNGTYCEELQWHSMKFRDYFDYLNHFRDVDGAGNKLFTFTNSEDTQVEIDTSEVVLVSSYILSYLWQHPN